jgi:hypothetical protein
MKTEYSSRNDVAHKGNDASEEMAALAVDVAGTLLNVLLPKILGDLGLKLEAGKVIAR